MTTLRGKGGREYEKWIVTITQLAQTDCNPFSRTGHIVPKPNYGSVSWEKVGNGYWEGI